MQISIIQAILIDTLYYLTNNGIPWLIGLGSISIRQPICAETIIGLILGKPVEDCTMGVTINTLYLDFVNAGDTLPTDPGIGSVVGTALALSTNITLQVAISIAVSLGAMGTMAWTPRQTVDIYFVCQTDKYTVTGDTKRMTFWQLVPTQLFGHAITMIPCALLAYFGAPATQGLLGMLAGKPFHILSVIGGIPPAIDIAIIIRTLGARNGIPILLAFGFFLETYSELSVLVVSVLATIAAYSYGELKFGKAGNEE